MSPESSHVTVRIRQRVLLVWFAFVVFLAGCSDDPVTIGLPARPELTGFPAGLGTAIADAETTIRKNPEDAAAWLGLGQLYHANGFPDTARACYERIAADSVVGARACYHLAQVEQLSGELSVQIRWLEASLRHQPDYAPARLLLAEARYKSGETAAAITDYAAVLARDPDNPTAVIGLARESMRKQDDAAALRMLEELTTQHPNSSTALSLLVGLVRQRGDAARAAVLLERAQARKDPPPMDPWTEELMRHCFDVQVLGMRLEDFIKSGRQNEALASLKQIESIDPQHWMVCWIRGLAAEQQGRPADAVREYERALTAGGEGARVYPALVANLVAQQRLPEAEARAREGLRALAGASTMVVALADVRARQHATVEATELLGDVLGAEPGHVAANRLLARIRWEAGDRAQAVPCLETVRRKSPGDLAARAMLGQYHLETNDPQAALAPLGEAHALEPQNEDIAGLLALAHLRLGSRAAQDENFTAALREYDAAIRVRPALAEAYANKVQVLLRLEAFGPAEEALQQLARLRPANAAIHLSLGDIQNSAGKPAAAQASWQTAMQLLDNSPDNRLRAALAERLASIVAP